FALPRKGQPLVVNGKLNCQVIITDDNPKGKDWKNRVADCGHVAMAEAALDLGTDFARPLLDGPLEVHFVFRMPRTAAHLRTDGSLKPSAPTRPTVRPDVLKL